MDKIIKKFNTNLEDLCFNIENELSEVLLKLKNIDDHNFKITKINSFEDSDQVLYGSGFYLILSDFNLLNNNCEIVINNTKVIYRGHCSRVKQRIRSHLFKSKYDLNKLNTDYKVCLKIDPKINGINIDDDFYSKYQWYVLTISMRNSNKLIRELCEKTFDKLYNKPLFSRD